MKEVSTIGLDLAKNVFQVHGIDGSGRTVIRRQLRRGQVLPFFKKLPPCRVGMEACATPHYWAREITALGHEVRMMPARYVKPYVKRNKNDVADAEAICEAVTRPSMRFVPIKTPAQQSILMLHRSRELFVHQRRRAGTGTGASRLTCINDEPARLRPLLTRHWAVKTKERSYDAKHHFPHRPGRRELLAQGTACSDRSRQAHWGAALRSEHCARRYV
jgi:transposase